MGWATTANIRSVPRSRAEGLVWFLTIRAPVVCNGCRVVQRSELFDMHAKVYQRHGWEAFRIPFFESSQKCLGNTFLHWVELKCCTWILDSIATQKYSALPPADRILKAMEYGQLPIAKCRDCRQLCKNFQAASKMMSSATMTHRTGQTNDLNLLHGGTVAHVAQLCKEKNLLRHKVGNALCKRLSHLWKSLSKPKQSCQACSMSSIGHCELSHVS